MPSYSTRGFVLKKTKLGETDLILTILAENGSQIRAVAKGARKPNSAMAPRLELFSIVDLLLHQGRSLDVISEVRLIEPNIACRSSAERAAAAAAVCEFLEIVTREAELEPRLYPMACEALRRLGVVRQEGLDLMLAAALLKFAAQIGYLPALGECALCGTPLTESPIYFWSFTDGGSLCEQCASYGRPAEIGEAGEWQGAGQSAISGYETLGVTTETLGAITLISGALLSWLRLSLGSRFIDIEKSLNDETDALRQLGSSLLSIAQEWIQAHLGITLKSLKSLALLRDFSPE